MDEQAAEAKTKEGWHRAPEPGAGTCLEGRWLIGDRYMLVHREHKTNHLLNFAGTQWFRFLVMLSALGPSAISPCIMAACWVGLKHHGYHLGVLKLIHEKCFLSCVLDITNHLPAVSSAVSASLFVQNLNGGPVRRRQIECYFSVFYVKVGLGVKDSPPSFPPYKEDECFAHLS